VRDLRIPWRRAVRDVSSSAHASGSPGVRALRVSGAVAGSTLCRVLGPEARIRASAFGDRLRRTGASARPRVEGAWPTFTCDRGSDSRRRRRPEAGGRGDRSRPG
jgi:hypothetical protein